MECNSGRLLCPWDFQLNNTGVGCSFLLQGIFLTQGSNPHLLHWLVDSLPLPGKAGGFFTTSLSYQGSPHKGVNSIFISFKAFFFFNV